VKRFLTMKKQILLTTLLGASIVSSAAFAAKPSTYVFLDGIGSNISTDVKDESTVSTSATDWSIDAANMPAFSKGDISDSAGGARLGMGMNFAENWAVEGSLAIFGEGTDTLQNQTNGDIELATRVRTYSLDFLRYFHITDQVSIYGKAGIDAWTVDIHTKQIGKRSDRDRDSGFMPTIAIGAKYELNDNWALRAELDYRQYNAEFSQYQTRKNPLAGAPNQLDVEGKYEKIGVDVEIISISAGAAYHF